MTTTPGRQRFKRGIDAANHGTVVIEPPNRFSSLQLASVWHSRELLFFLAWRDIKVRYAQAALGVLWALLQPLLMMAVFALFLGRLAKVPSDGSPYALFSFAGLLPWTLFSSSLGAATNSVVGNANLVSRVWFPRLVLPAAALVSFLPDIAIGSALLVVLMPLYGVSPPATLVLLPVFVGFALLASASIGVWLAALNVAYRDVRHAVPFLIQLWLFATPVAYPSSVVPQEFRLLFAVNPMAGVVEGFRWAVLGGRTPPWGMMAVSACVSTAALLVGLYYFRRVEHGFPDVI